MAVVLGRKPGGAGGGGGGAPSGPAGGDLAGTYPNPTISATAPVVHNSLYDANTVLAATTDDTPAAVTMGASTFLARLAAGNIKAASVAEVLTLLDTPTNAQAVLKTLYDANTILAADTDNTPAALTVGASTIVARLAAGNIKAASVAEIITLLQAYTVGGTDVAVADGGTGASTAATALANLGVAYVRICGTTLGAPAATLDTNTQLGGNIPGTYSGLVMQVMGATSNSGATLGNLTLNADTGSNYDYQTMTGSGTTVSATESFAQANVPVITIPGTSAASKAGISVITLPFYAGTTFHKELTTQAGYSEGTTGDLLNTRMRFGLWRNTAAVTRITITPGAGNWVTGTAYALYGLL